MSRNPIRNDLGVECLGTHICASDEKPDWGVLLTIYGGKGIAVNMSPTELVTVDRRLLTSEKSVSVLEGKEIWRL